VLGSRKNLRRIVDEAQVYPFTIDVVALRHYPIPSKHLPPLVGFWLVALPVQNLHQLGTMHPAAIVLSSAVAGLLAFPASAASTDIKLEQQDRMLSNSNTGERSWPNLIPKRRTIPPYDRYRWALVTEWDPFSDLPLAALQSDDKKAAGPTRRPSSPPTWEGFDILDELPPSRTSPTPAPTFGPTTLDEWADFCGVDGYGFLTTVTLKDKWGDGWDGTFLTIRDAATQVPVYSGTLRGNDGKERVDRVCLKVWSCYEVVVTGSQWSDEISWSIDRMETDYFWLLKASRQVERVMPLEDQLAQGVANQRCTFALTDVSLMDGCAATCDGNQPTGTVGVVDEKGEVINDGEGGGGGGGGDGGGGGTTKIRRPTSAPTVAPTPQPTLSDDFSEFGGGGRQPTVPLGFGGNGGTSTALRPTSNFPFQNPFQNPFEQRPVSTGGAQATVRDGATSNTGTNMDGTAVIRGTARPTPAPTTAKPTLPPAFKDPNMPYRPQGYFNYDPFDGYYGPVAWSKWFPGCGVGVTEFDQSGVGIEGSIGDGRQAPIHLGEDGMNVECEATHEIRTRAAEFSLCDDEAGLFSITPSRLRLDFTAKNRNPWTDLPDGFGAMDAKYLEIAYPAIHTIEENGRRKRYDAEYTIVHDFERRKKATLISILIDATGFRNERFQDLLDEWSKVDTCRTPANEKQFFEEIHRFDRRKLRAEPPKEHQQPETQDDTTNKHRDLACAFNIYHRTLMPSTYYYAYQGSLPEPPCTYKDYLPGTSEWRVINKPMKISPEQLEQLKALVEFGPCKDNEFAQDMGVWRARPVQESNARSYWQCKRDSFPLDCEKDGYCDCDAVLCPEDFA